MADVVVDGIFGVGSARDVGGVYGDAVQLINESGKKVFAIDIPSGVDADTGLEMGSSVRTDCTIALGLPKIGNLLYPGYERCGKLYARL